MMEELGEFAQKLQDFFSGTRSGAHWGSGATSRPAEQATLGRGLDYQLGMREAAEAARDIAEQRLLCGPGANLPRWTRRNSNSVVTCFADPNRLGWYCVQHVLEPRNAAHKTALLEYGDFVGRQILLAQNSAQDFRFDPVAGSEEAVTVLENDLWSFRAIARTENNSFTIWSQCSSAPRSS